MKIGVVVGRFQTPILTVAHKQLIKKAAEENDRLVVFILDTHIGLTDANPLPYLVREDMVETFLKNHIDTNYEVVPLMEQKYSSILVTELDNMLVERYGWTTQYTLYRGENGFMYDGLCNVQTLYFKSADSASLRSKCYDNMLSGYRELHGIIHSLGHKKFTCYNFIVSYVQNGNGVLVHKPHGMKKLCLPTILLGAFDESMEEASKNIVKDLAPELVISEPTYIKGFKTDDWRLRNVDDFAYYHLFHIRRFTGNLGTLKTYNRPFNPDLFENEYRPIIEYLNK